MAKYTIKEREFVTGQSYYAILVGSAILPTTITECKPAEEIISALRSVSNDNELIENFSIAYSKQIYEKLERDFSAGKIVSLSAFDNVLYDAKGLKSGLNARVNNMRAGKYTEYITTEWINYFCHYIRLGFYSPENVIWLESKQADLSKSK